MKIFSACLWTLTANNCLTTCLMNNLIFYHLETSGNVLCCFLHMYIFLEKWIHRKRFILQFLNVAVTSVFDLLQFKLKIRFIKSTLKAVLRKIDIAKLNTEQQNLCCQKLKTIVVLSTVEHHLQWKKIILLRSCLAKNIVWILHTKLHLPSVTSLRLRYYSLFFLTSICS